MNVRFFFVCISRFFHSAWCRAKQYNSTTRYTFLKFFLNAFFHRLSTPLYSMVHGINLETGWHHGNTETLLMYEENPGVP